MNRERGGSLEKGEGEPLGSLGEARDVAVAAARAAGGIIRAQAGRLSEQEVREKAMHDIVTAADEEAQRVIVEVLRRAYPSHAILGEEGQHRPTEAEVGTRPCWFIDPIDGTTNFTRGVPPYAVSIGLQVAGQRVVGVVLDVSRDELFTAIRGGGLYVNGVPARVSPAASLNESLVATGFPFRAFEHVDAYLAVLRRFMHEVRGLRRPGSAAVDLAYVACGRFDGFFEMALMPWDVAAGALLVEEGGGRVTDMDGRPYSVFEGHILASNGLLHAAMLDVVAPLREAKAEHAASSSTQELR